MQKEFLYLPYLIPFIFLEVIFITLVFKYWSGRRKVETLKDEELDSNIDSSILDDEEDPNTAIYTFNSTFASGIRRSKDGAVILCFSRFICMLYFIGVDVIANLYKHKGWQYFTTWNCDLIGLYFALAFSVSVIGLRFDSPDVEWSYSVRCLGQSVHILFEIAGASAFLVTVVAFTLLDPTFDFWNASVHFATTLSMLLEMSLNSIFVRFDHYPFNTYWALVYLIFIWPIVVSGIRPWPYFFLKVDSAYCFAWYTGLLIVNFIFYCLWYGFSRLKLCLYRRNKTLISKDVAVVQRNDFQLSGSMVLVNWTGDGGTGEIPGAVHRDRDSAISC